MVKSSNEGFDPETRLVELKSRGLETYHAQKIVELEHKKDRDNFENELLPLLYNPHTRLCAEIIANLQNYEEGEIAILEDTLLRFLTMPNPDVSEEVKLFVAVQYRKHAINAKSYRCVYKESNEYPPIYAQKPSSCIAYLDNKASKTPAEIRLLQLFKSPDMRRCADRIIMLEYLTDRTTYEERYLTLLRDPRYQKQCHQIVELECLGEINEKNARHLELLYSPETCDHAAEIVALEFKNEKTFADKKRLIILSNPRFLNHEDLISEKEFHQAQQLELDEIDIIQEYFIAVISPSSRRLSLSPYASLSLLSAHAPINEFSPHALSKNKSKSELKEKIIKDCVELRVQNLLDILFGKNVPDILDEKHIIRHRMECRLVFAVIQHFYALDALFKRDKLENLLHTLREKLSLIYGKNLIMSQKIELRLYDVVQAVIQEAQANYHVLSDDDSSCSPMIPSRV